MNFDLLLKLAPAISAVAATISACAAFLTVRSARMSQTLSRQTAQYQRLVTEPGANYVSRFRELALPLIENGLSELRVLLDENRHDQIRGRKDKLIQDFKRMERRECAVLLSGADTLNEIGYYGGSGRSPQELIKDLEAARDIGLDGIAGEVVQAIDNVTQDTSPFEHWINRHTIAVSAVLHRYDPASPRRKRFESKGTVLHRAP